MRVGVLALQGAFREHAAAVADCGASPVEIRHPGGLATCQALIIPGGESTTIGKLMQLADFPEALRWFWESGGAIFGTCAGMVLLAKIIAGRDQFSLGLMDITVVRNAFGRQTDSFETDLIFPVIGSNPVRAVFIRAPHITKCGPEVESLGAFEGNTVFAKQGRLLAASFHPELTTDRRVHQYFLDVARG